jgi:hypothetical protein
MSSSVPNSERAIAVNIEIMRDCPTVREKPDYLLRSLVGYRSR